MANCMNPHCENGRSIIRATSGEVAFSSPCLECRHRPERPPDWLSKQVDFAQRDIDSWPDWMTQSHPGKKEQDDG